MLMAVKFNSIDENYENDDDVALIEVDKDVVVSFFDYNVESDKDFDSWLLSHHLDDVKYLYSFAHDRDSVYKIKKPNGDVEELSEVYCPTCDLMIRPRKSECKCYRCGKDIVR